MVKNRRVHNINIAVMYVRLNSNIGCTLENGELGKRAGCKVSVRSRPTSNGIYEESLETGVVCADGQRSISRLVRFHWLLITLMVTGEIILKPTFV